MDGIEALNKVIIVAATNRPDILDLALTRPGRFDHMVLVPPPDFKGREEIFKINIFGNNMPVSEEILIDNLASRSEVYYKKNMNGFLLFNYRVILVRKFASFAENLD